MVPSISALYELSYPTAKQVVTDGHAIAYWYPSVPDAIAPSCHDVPESVVTKMP